MNIFDKRKKEAEIWPLYKNNPQLFGIKFLFVVQDGPYNITGRDLKIASGTILRGILPDSYKNKKCVILRSRNGKLDPIVTKMLGFERYSIRDQDLPWSTGVGIAVDLDVDVQPGDVIMDCESEEY